MKQLLAVGDEEKPRTLACRRMLLTSPAAIVERGDHRLTSAGGGHDQVPVAPLNPTFGIEPVENLLLKRVGPQLERKRLGAGRSDRPLFLQCPLQPRPLGLVIRLELAVLPVGLERRDDAVPQMGRLVLAQLDGPLQPLGQGRVRQVGRADVGASRSRSRGETGTPWRAAACDGYRKRRAPRCWAAIRMRSTAFRSVAPR